MTKNKEVDGRCELCGTRGKILRVRKYGHNWKLCRTCRDDKSTNEKMIAMKKAILGEKGITEKSEIEKDSFKLERIREEAKLIDKALIIQKEIEEIDGIIKLIKDCRNDARNIVVAYRHMLLELESLRMELLMDK